jgi:hypothetical protein
VTAVPGKDLNYRITVDQAAGSAGIRDFSRTVTSELRNVDSALSDTATASQRAAQTLNAMAGAAETELVAAKRAADALAAALGPEMAAKLGQNGVAQAVGDLNRMGVAFDEVEADADELAAAIKRVDAVQTSAIDQGLGNVGGKLRDVRGEADQSRSVLANMSGNSMQTLTGGMGDLSMALGQVAEYATEGNISLSNLAMVAGPMAGLAAATQLFAESTKSRADSAKVAAAQTEMLTKAYRQGGDAAHNYADALNELGEVQVSLGRNKTAEDVGGLTSIYSKLAPIVTLGAEALGLFGEATADLTPLLAKAGVSTEAWAAAVVGGNQVFGELATALQRTTLTAEEQATILAGLTDAQADNTEAKRNASAMEAVFGAAVDDSTKSLDDTAAAADRAARRTADLEAKWAALTGVLSDQSAFLSVQDALDDVRDKGAEAWDAASSGAADAEQKSRDYQASVIAAKEQVIELGRQLGLSIPEVQRMLLDIDDHEIDQVERELNIMARNRTMQLSIIAHGGTTGGSGYAGTGINPTALPPAPSGRGVRGLPVADTAPAAAATVPELAFPITVVAAAPAGPSSLTLDMRGAILGSRYDIVRTVRVAVRDGVRLAGSRNVLR